ncbi:MAG: two pore domain potassium channel family protein [Alistipes sp.]|nr:two pore domain potassium channel family protein [Alistipes sp.]
MKMFFVVMRFGIDFEPLARMNTMRKFFQARRDRLLYAMHLLRLAGGVALLAAFSWEVLLGPTHHLSNGYLQLQLVVCLLFLADFGVSWAFAARRKHYFFRHLIYLLLSIPWLNLIAWSGVHLTRPWQVLTGMIPVWLLVLATYLLIEWFNELRIARLFYTYLAATLLCTYLGALIFYEVEGGLNGSIGGFGDALWWAGQNLTTLGATIQPTTPVGKMLTVLLPLLGMLFLPIFTTYIMNMHSRRE